MWFLYFSGTKLYPEPIYYTVYETEDVIIKYSREIYHDIYGIVEQTTESVNKRYENKTIEEIEIESILRVRSESSKKIKDYVEQHK